MDKLTVVLMSIKRLNKERRPLVLTPTVAKKVSDKNMRAWVSTVYFSNLIKDLRIIQSYLPFVC